MLRLISGLIILGALVTSCSDDTSPPAADGNPGIDADPNAPDAMPTGPDAMLGTAATVVDCAAVTPVDQLWYYSGVGFMEPQQLGVGDVLRIHSLEGHTAWHDDGLWSASDETCVQFDGAGDYGWYCYFHPQERGTIVVRQEVAF